MRSDGIVSNVPVVGRYSTDQVSVGFRTGIDWTRCAEAYILQKDVRPASKATYAKALHAFLAWAEENGVDLNIVGKVDILRYKEDLHKQELSANTQNLYIVAVRGFYAWLSEVGLYGDVAKGVKTARHSKKYRKLHLTEDQSVRLLDVAENEGIRNYALVNLMLRTGLRTVEVARANVGHVEVIDSRRVLRVWGKGKDSPDDFVILSDEAYEPLKRYLDTRTGVRASDPLFAGEGRGSSGHRLTTRMIQLIVKRELRAIGLDSHSYSAHSLRRTCGVQILKNGGTMFDVQTVLRHLSPATSQIYVDGVKDEMRMQSAPEFLLNKSFKSKSNVTTGA